MENTSTLECPYCNTTLPTRGFFCPSCREQAKCKACSELLEINASGCVMCGAEVGASTTHDKSDTPLSGQEQRNRIRYQKKGNHISLDADITDSASAYFADTLGFIVTSGTLPPRSKQNRSLFLGKEKPSGTIPLTLPSAQKADLSNFSEFDDDDLDIEVVIRKIFTFDNNELKLVDPRLKHSGKLDQAVRLTLLVIYTYELNGSPQIERSTLTEILRQSKLDDGHSREWISKSNELIIKGNLIELSVPGREVAKAIIAEIADQSLDVGKVSYSKPKGGRSAKRKKDILKGQSTSSSDNKSSTSKTSAMAMFKILIEEGFFNEKRKIKDIIQHCSTNKAQHYRNNDLSGPLGRSIKDGLLKREKNKSDNQYEYYA